MDHSQKGDSHYQANSKPGIRPWIYCFIATLFFFYEFIQMNMFNALSFDLTESLSLTASELGNLSASYFYAMLLTLFPAGLILEHVRVKKVILFAMSISIVGTFLLSMSNSFLTTLLSRFLSGLGGAFAFQCALRVAKDNLPLSRLAFINGLIVTFGLLGGIAAQTPITLLVKNFDWHQVLWMYVSMGMAFLIIIGLFLPKEVASKNLSSLSLRDDSGNSIGTANTLSLLGKIKLSSKNSQTWLASFYTALFNLPIPLLGATWGNLYLIQTHQFSELEASNTISLLFLGVLLGGPFFGWWSDRLKKRRLPMMLSGFLTLLIVLAIIYLSVLSKVSIAILFFGLGFFSSTQIIGYSVLTESNPQASSTALGIAALLIMAIGAIAQPFFGWLIESQWHENVTSQIHLYPPDSFNVAILILPVSFIVGLAVTFFLKETFHYHPKT